LDKKTRCKLARRIAKSKKRLKHRNSLIFTKRKNMEYNFIVNLGVPAHFVKKTDFAILLANLRKTCKTSLALIYSLYCVVNSNHTVLESFHQPYRTFSFSLFLLFIPNRPSCYFSGDMPARYKITAILVFFRSSLVVFLTSPPNNLYCSMIWFMATHAINLSIENFLMTGTKLFTVILVFCT